VGRCDDVVTSIANGSDGHELGRLTGGCGDGGRTTLEHGHSLLEDIDGGVTNARVQVAVLAESEEIRAMLSWLD
jgi:hypothetical protein